MFILKSKLQQMKNMKRCIVAIVVLLAFADGFAQFEIDWGPEIAVSQDGDDNNRPRIVANGNDILVMWGKNDGNAIMYSTWEDNAFAPAQSMLDSGIHVFTSDWAGPEIAARDDIFVVFKAIPENEMGAYIVKSQDWGETWSDTLRIDQPSEGNEQSRFPNVSTYYGNNPAITMMTFEGNYIDPKYVVATSDDGGQSFGPLLNVSTDFFEGEACDCCTASILASGGELYHAYRNNHDNIREIRASHSANWGESVEEAFVMDTTQTYSDVCFSSGPDLAYDNGLISVFKAIGDDGSRVMISKRDLQGNLSVHTPIDLSPPATVSQNNPRIEVEDAFSMVVWEEFTSTNSNVLFSMSMFGISEIGLEVDTVNIHQTGNQINPDIAIDYDAVHVVWQDQNTGLVKYRRGELPPYSIEELQNSKLSTAYPNPASTVVNVAAKESEIMQSVEMYNLKGKLVKRIETNTNTIEMDIQGLDEAIYVLSVQFSSGKREKHLVHILEE